MKQNKGFFNKKDNISLSQDTTKSKTQSNLTPKPSHKKLRIFGATSLAVFMSATALFAFLPLTQTKISASPSNPTAEAVKLTPETDPTVFTTDDGLEIKSHTVSATGSESTIQYFTLGSYNGTPVNWLIVGVSSSSISTNSSPAGTAIKNDTEKQKLVTGAISSDLLENQILCISEYALNQEDYNPNFVAKASYRFNFNSSNASTNSYKATTDQWTDYYQSYTALNVALNTASLGTTLGLNEYYGNGSGRIVTNNAFAENFIFSLNSSLYTTFVGSENYKVPYLFTETSTPTNIYTSNTLVSGTVTSYFSYSTQSGSYKATGSGAAYAYIAYIISSNGSVLADTTLANFSASVSNNNVAYDYYDGNMNYYNFTTSYSVTNHSISAIAYRPAFVWQL